MGEREEEDKQLRLTWQGSMARQRPPLDFERRNALAILTQLMKDGVLCN